MWRRACQIASGKVASTSRNNKWIGLHGPHSRMVWINSELAATSSISAAHDQPTKTVRNRALWRGELSRADGKGGERRKRMDLNDGRGAEKWGKGHVWGLM